MDNIIGIFTFAVLFVANIKNNNNNNNNNDSALKYLDIKLKKLLIFF